MSVELKLTGHDKGFGSGFVVRRLLPVRRNASRWRPTTGRHRRWATYRVKPNSYRCRNGGSTPGEVLAAMNPGFSALLIQ